MQAADCLHNSLNCTAQCCQSRKTILQCEATNARFRRSVPKSTDRTKPRVPTWSVRHSRSSHGVSPTVDIETNVTLVPPGVCGALPLLTVWDLQCQGNNSAHQCCMNFGEVHFHPNCKKNSSENTFIQKHFHPKTLLSKNTFLQKHFQSKREDNFIHDTIIASKTGSSNDTFIQKRFRPMMLSSKNGFVQ